MHTDPYLRGGGVGIKIALKGEMAIFLGYDPRFRKNIFLVIPFLIGGFGN